MIYLINIFEINLRADSQTIAFFFMRQRYEKKNKVEITL